MFRVCLAGPWTVGGFVHEGQEDRVNACHAVQAAQVVGEVGEFCTIAFGHDHVEARAVMGVVVQTPMWCSRWATRWTTGWRCAGWSAPPVRCGSNVVVTDAVLAQLALRYDFFLHVVPDLAPDQAPDAQTLEDLEALRDAWEMEHVIFDRPFPRAARDALTGLGLFVVVIDPFTAPPASTFEAGANLITAMEDAVTGLRTSMRCR